jgi:rod shape-determining protein MreC
MRNIVLLFSRYHVLLLFLLLEIIAIKLIGNSHKYQEIKMANASNVVTGNWYSFTNKFYKYFSLSYENEKLAQENIDLRKKLLIVNNYASDSLLPSYRDSVSYDYIPAKIIDNSLNKSINYITLNKGKNEGIEKGMGVLTGTGIFGIITNVSSNYSLAMSVISTKSMISVKHSKSNAFGNLTWSGKNPFLLHIENISKTVPVKVLDTFVTTGFSTFFPPDIPAAIVKSVSTDPSTGFLDIKVILSNNIDKITNVYIVKHSERKEIDSLIHVTDAIAN